MNNQGLRLGDKVGVVGSPHVGIVVRVTPFKQFIAHNDKGRRVVVVSLEQFAMGRGVRVLERVGGGRAAQAQVVRRALSLIGKPYDLVGFNCQHYASYAQTGEATSPLVQLAVVTLLVIVGIAATSEA